MKRVSAFIDQLDYPAQPSLAAWDFNRCARSQTEAAQSVNKRDKKRLILLIVWNIEKDLVRPKA